MDGMNKFTVLKAFTLGICGRDYETEIQNRYLLCMIGVFKKNHVSLLHQKLHQVRLFCSRYAFGVISACFISL